MPMYRNALLLAAGLAALSLAAPSGALAQKYYEGGAKTYRPAPTLKRRTSKPTITHVQRLVVVAGASPIRAAGSRAASAIRTAAGRIAAAGTTAVDGITAISAGTSASASPSAPRCQPSSMRCRATNRRPAAAASSTTAAIDEPIDHVRRHTPRRRSPPRRTTRRGPSGAPPAGETRLIPDEVVIELSNSVSAQQVTALQQPLPAAAPRVASLRAQRHHVIPLAHPRPPLGGRGGARARARSRGDERAAELPLCAAAERDQGGERRRPRAIRARQAASAAGARAGQEATMCGWR